MQTIQDRLILLVAAFRTFDEFRGVPGVEWWM